MLARQGFSCLRHASSPVSSGYFDTECHFCPGQSGLQSFSFMLPTITGMTSAYQYTQVLVELKSHYFLPGVVLDHYPPDLSF
jgi:hypothetical protein